MSEITSFSDILQFEDFYWNENVYLKDVFGSFFLSSNYFLATTAFL